MRSPTEAKRFSKAGWVVILARGFSAGAADNAVGRTGKCVKDMLDGGRTSESELASGDFISVQITGRGNKAKTKNQQSVHSQHETDQIRRRRDAEFTKVRR
jgi:hypothetical protein